MKKMIFMMIFVSLSLYSAKSQKIDNKGKWFTFQDTTYIPNEKDIAEIFNGISFLKPFEPYKLKNGKRFIPTETTIWGNMVTEEISKIKRRKIPLDSISQIILKEGKIVNQQKNPKPSINWGIRKSGEIFISQENFKENTLWLEVEGHKILKVFPSCLNPNSSFDLSEKNVFSQASEIAKQETGETEKDVVSEVQLEIVLKLETTQSKNDEYKPGEPWWYRYTDAHHRDSTGRLTGVAVYNDNWDNNSSSYNYQPSYYWTPSYNYHPVYYWEQPRIYTIVQPVAYRPFLQPRHYNRIIYPQKGGPVGAPGHEAGQPTATPGHGAGGPVSVPGHR